MFWNQRRDCYQGHQHDHHDHFEHYANRGRHGRGGGPRGRPDFGFGRQGGPGGDWAGMFGGEPPRADRGAVRYLVLDAIAAQPRHGYDVISHIEQRSKGSYRPSPGVIYPTLQLLEDVGHIKTIDAEGRKAFEITEAGTKDLAENREAVDDFYDRAGGNPFEHFANDLHDVRNHIFTLMKTFRRAMWHGQLSTSKLNQVKEVLEEAAKKIEAIFAEKK